jgi:hypothetical protein
MVVEEGRKGMNKKGKMNGNGQTEEQRGRRVGMEEKGERCGMLER